MSSLKLFIVRHGESVGNKLKVTQGQTDYDLTEKGINQAKKIAERLKNERIDIVYSSDLKRAFKTMEEIIKFHPNIKKVQSDKNLRERCKGIFQGKPKELLDAELVKSNSPYYIFEPKEGESLITLYNKLFTFSDKLKVESQDNNILVVAHGEPIACILMHLLNKPVENYREFLTKNTSLSILEIKENNIKLSCLDCTNHLE